MASMNAAGHYDTETAHGAGDWLATFKERTSADQRRWRTLQERWATARLLLFVAAVAVWFVPHESFLLKAVGCAVLLAGFAAAVRRHRVACARREFADHLLLIIGESEQRVGGQVKLVRGHARPGDPEDAAARLAPIFDAGPVWKLSAQELDDLDVYALPVGVFGLLNRTSTVLGARRLREMVEAPGLSPQHILARQQAVRWLEEHPAARLRMMAAAAALRREDHRLDGLVKALREAESPANQFSSLSLRVWSLFSGALALVALVRLGSENWRPWCAALLALLVFNGVHVWRMRKGVGAFLARWGALAGAARGLLGVARQAGDELPPESALGSLRERFVAISARDRLPALCRRLAWAEGGGMIQELLNVLVFYNLHVAEWILACLLPLRNELLTGLSATAELEALLSLACFAGEQSQRTYPVPTVEPALKIIAGRHPLLSPEQVVANDVRLVAPTHVWVITGSNMSGKSTLLRMAGVNVLLAQMGTTVLAGEMNWAPMRLITDLRSRDNLSKDESYFLAEVRQLRRMVVPPPDGAPVLGLIDEPLRGTNSDEQTAAGLAVLKHLIDSRHFFLLATHERRLTELADGRTAQNLHFQENIEGDGLVFDYRLRSGPARTRNALRLLEKEGYPDGIVADALRQMDRPDS